MIFQKILKYCKENNLSISAFESKCNIGNGTVGKWKDDASKPTLSTLEKIQKATRLPINYWLE